MKKIIILIMFILLSSINVWSHSEYSGPEKFALGCMAGCHKLLNP